MQPPYDVLETILYTFGAISSIELSQEYYKDMFKISQY